MPARRLRRWEADVTAPYSIDVDGTVNVAAESFAAAVVEKLSASVIPSSLPARVGDWIRQTAQYNSLLWTHTIPMNPAGTAMIMEWRLNPDGTLNLELRDSTGQTFWRGTFQPVEPPDA
jgi:hypothetical protein